MLNTMVLGLLVTGAVAAVGLTSACSDDTGSNGDGGSTATTTTDTATGGSDACANDSPIGIANCIESERYVADLTLIAQPRPPGSSHWQTVQDLCADRFTSLGFAVERHQYATGINVIGVKAGQTARQVLITAHYDSTDDTCPGADDNATGVSAVLESARVLADASFEHTLVFACWDEEEAGLIGSNAYAARSASQSEDIAIVFNYEMIGYYDDTPNTQEVPPGFNLVFPEQIAELEAREFRADFIAIVADDLALGPATALEQYADAYDLINAKLVVTGDQKTSPAFADLRRSDHASFWDRNYPAMMITDTANFRYAPYHCYEGVDEVANLNHDFSTKVMRATVAAAVDSASLLP